MTDRRKRCAARRTGGRCPILLLGLMLSACAAPEPVSEPVGEIATPSPAATNAAPQAGAIEAVSQEQSPRPRRLRIAAVGDMMLGTDYPENRLPDDDAAGFLEHVTPLLSSADLAFGNLEGVLADDAEPVKECTNPNACYLFRSPTRYADLFDAAGFDGLSLANNHARDFGEEGRSETMRALAARGIAHSGREGDFASIAWEGLDIAFLAFAVTRESNLLHDYALAESIVAEHAASHDLVVVSFHGGAEGRGTTRTPFAEEWYYGEPRGDVVRFARSMVDAGADFVFGHGPHVLRAMENYRGHLIAYSLGNFATYYGISVDGLRGIAPVLVVTIDDTGRFLEGHIHSTIQVRPGGPRPDPGMRAFEQLRKLSAEDLRDPGIEFHADGRITPAERHFVRPVGDGEAPSEH